MCGHLHQEGVALRTRLAELQSMLHEERAAARECERLQVTKKKEWNSV